MGLSRLVVSVAATLATAAAMVGVSTGSVAAADSGSSVSVHCFANSAGGRGARIDDTVAWASAAAGQTLTIRATGCSWFYFDTEVLQASGPLTSADPSDDTWAYLVPESGTITLQVIAKPKPATWAVSLFPLPYTPDGDPTGSSSAIMWTKRSGPWGSSVVAGLASKFPRVISVHWTDASTSANRVTGYRIGIRTVIGFDEKGSILSKPRWTKVGPKQFTKVWTESTFPKPDPGKVCTRSWDMQVIPLTKTGALLASPWRSVSEGGGC